MGVSCTWAFFHQNPSPAGLSDGPPPWGVDSGLRVLLLLSFPKMHLATVPEPHHPSSSPYLSTPCPCGWTPKISRQAWDEASSEPAGHETSPDMARVTSLGQAGAPHQPSPGGAADISSVMAPTTFCASSGPSTSLLSVRFPGKFRVKRQSRGGRVYTIQSPPVHPSGQGRKQPREGTASSKVTGKRAVP